MGSSARGSADSANPPDPGQAGSLDDLATLLRRLKVWAGSPSYERITDRINTAWQTAGWQPSDMTSKNTVADCFKTGRRRVNTDLVLAIVETLNPDRGYVAQWRQAMRVIDGETSAAAQVRVQDTLPQDLMEFTGRTTELGRLRTSLHRAQRNGATQVICAIEGMAGIGKTQLAIHAAHLYAGEHPGTQILFVNLRGFHPDPAQPPADPSAVLDGFLRLLGVPGQHIPHELAARTALLQERLAGSRALIILDNAASVEQIRPLLPTTPDGLTLITSRRRLSDLDSAIHLGLDVFTPTSAVEYLTRAVHDIPTGDDPQAAARIAVRCGYLPLALGLIAGHIRATQGWTLTDHADRLDERHQRQQLDSGVALALALSYQDLPEGQQQLLRLAALHPGQDLDAFAAAALTGTDLATAQDAIEQLHRDHLLQQTVPGRYSLHDLVRAYAAQQAFDLDPPRRRNAATTRLLDYHLAVAAASIDLAYPYERLHHAAITPASTPTPDLADRHQAEQWLDTELANVLAAARYAGNHGWPEHIWQISATLDRHLFVRGHYQDGESLHLQALALAQQHGDRQAQQLTALNGLGNIHRRLGRQDQAENELLHALLIAQNIGDSAGEQDALRGLAIVHWRWGRNDEAHNEFAQALQISQTIGHPVGEHQALACLGDVYRAKGRYTQAEDYYQRALKIAQTIGDTAGQHGALTGLGDVCLVLDQYEQADNHYRQARHIAQAISEPIGELWALCGIGQVNLLLGRHDQATAHFDLALNIARACNHPVAETAVLHGLGEVHRALGSHDEATRCYQQVLDNARKYDITYWQFEAMQSFGRLHHTAGHLALALEHHEQALKHATSLAQPADQARAHDGLANAYRSLDQPGPARQHWQTALDLLTDLGIEHTDEMETTAPKIRARLANLDQQQPRHVSARG